MISCLYPEPQDMPAGSKSVISQKLWLVFQIYDVLNQ